MSRKDNLKELIEQWDFLDTEVMDEKIDAYEQFVGRFIIKFSYLETKFNVLLADIINERSHDIGYAIIAPLSFANKIELLERYTKLAKSAGDVRLPKLANLTPLIKDINSFRNSVAHANWASMNDDNMVRVKVYVDEESGVWFRLQKISYQDICKKCHTLEDLVILIENIWDDEFLDDNPHLKKYL